MNLFSHPEASTVEMGKRLPRYKRIVRGLWRLFALGFVGVVLFFTILSFQDLPTFEDLENPNINEATEVYAYDGQVFGRYYVENRVPVDYEDLSPHLINALIATEDERYYKHSGIDGKALIRVAVKTVFFGDASSGGGSTITQQLAKLLYSDRNFRGMSKLEKMGALFSRKFKEWITAVKLERSYTKEEIIAMYLNKFNFINGAYGIKAAAEIYFGKPQEALEIQEAATLIGMLKNPSLFNPLRRIDTTLHRRMVVLKQMLKNDMLSQLEYDTLRKLPMGLDPHKVKHYQGPAPYFRAEMLKECKAILKDIPGGKKYNPYTDGLRIYTTIDLRVQKHMETAMMEHMPGLQKKFWKRWEGKDPWTYKTKETTDREIEIRKLSLKTLVRNSERYQNLRNKFLGSVLEELKKEEAITLLDRDIERMMEEDKNKGVLGRLVSNNTIDEERAISYKKVMRSDKWQELRKQWKAFNKAVNEAFSTPVKMKVFAYNGKMEKDTVMSPFDSIKYHRMFLQIGSMAVDPATGFVRGWLGGINHKYFKYDHVTTARQVGSTFKPFIYSTAIALQGFSPCFTVIDQPYTILPGEGNFYLQDEWTPQNARGTYTYETYTLKDALKRSKNTVSVYLMKQLGDAEPVRVLVNNMGLNPNERLSNGEAKIPRVPSICLGSADLTVLEMTGAYTTFANQGHYSKPVFIDRIEDRNGKIIYSAELENRQALSEEANYVMVELLRHVAAGSRDFHGLKSDIGGKTGTTNDFTDGWYVGLTPDLVIGTWVGGADRWIRFFNLNDGQGGTMARPLFGKVIRKLENDEEADYNASKRFRAPRGGINITLDCGLYKDTRPLDEIESEENENFGEDIFADEVLENYTPKGPQNQEENENF